MKSKYQKLERKAQRIVVRSARNLTPLFLNSPGVIFNSLIRRGKSHYITGASTNRTASTSKEKDGEYGNMYALLFLLTHPLTHSLILVSTGIL